MEVMNLKPVLERLDMALRAVWDAHSRDLTILAGPAIHEAFAIHAMSLNSDPSVFGVGVSESCWTYRSIRIRCVPDLPPSYVFVKRGDSLLPQVWPMPPDIAWSDWLSDAPKMAFDPEAVRAMELV